MNPSVNTFVDDALTAWQIFRALRKHAPHGADIQIRALDAPRSPETLLKRRLVVVDTTDTPGPSEPAQEAP